MRVTRFRHINDNSYLVTSTDCFSVPYYDRVPMTQWLADNAIDFKVTFDGAFEWHFKILTKTDQQKQNLMFFELKWMHNES